MKKFSYDFEITEQDEATADRKIAALSKLCKKLTAEDLETFAAISEKDPQKLAMARAYLKLNK